MRNDKKRKAGKNAWINAFFINTPQAVFKKVRWTGKSTLKLWWANFRRIVTAKNVLKVLFPVLIIIFILLIIGMFFAFRQSNQVELTTLEAQYKNTQVPAEQIAIQEKINHIKSWSAQLWEFCGTDTFKTVGLSVLLTTLITILGNIFKVKEAFEERIRAQRAIRVETQTDCIKASEQMWDKLYCLANKVRFYDKDAIEKFNSDSKVEIKDRKQTIDDLLEECEHFASQAEEIVNQWHIVFPILPKIGEESNRNITRELKRQRKARLKRQIKEYTKKVEEEEHNPRSANEAYAKLEYFKEELKNIDEDVEQDYLTIRKIRKPSQMILFFVNMLYEATCSVAYYIKKEHSKVKAIQNCLGVIQDVTKDLVHQNMLVILKCSVEPQDGYGDIEQYTINKNNINKSLEYLFLNYDAVKRYVYRFMPIPDVVEKDTELQKILENFLDRMGKSQNLGNDDKVAEEKYLFYESLKKSFNKMGGGCVGEGWEYRYSVRMLKELSSQLGFLSVKEELESRILWLRINKLVGSEN